jgi:thymidine phosphorylase
MLTLAGLDPKHPDHDPEIALDSGRALQVWNEMVRAQGGDPEAVLPVAKHRREITSTESGYVGRLDAYPIGVAAWRLGAGRAHKDDVLSPGAGVRWFHKEGDPIQAGEVIFELLTDEESRFAGAIELLNQAMQITPVTPVTRPLVRTRITG